MTSTPFLLDTALAVLVRQYCSSCDHTIVICRKCFPIVPPCFMRYRAISSSLITIYRKCFKQEKSCIVHVACDQANAHVPSECGRKAFERVETKLMLK